MSQENVTTVRNIYEAFGRGDIAAVLAAMDEQIEWREADNFIYADGNPYIGPQAILGGVFARLAQEWDGFSVSAVEILDAGDKVVSSGHYTGKFKASGASVRSQFAHFFS
ncbi:MAG: nuclear transport factor 2 family protein, partial [Pyrinomonadaceae bacterium]